MKELRLLDAPGTATAPAWMGEAGAGQSVTSSAQLKNTGTEPLTSIKMWVTNEPGLPATLTVSVAGIALTDAPQEVLTGPLAPGDSVAVLATFTAPATGMVAGEDSGGLHWLGS